MLGKTSVRRSVSLVRWARLMAFLAVPLLAVMAPSSAHSVTVKRSEAQRCDGSTSQLGENVPVSSSDRQHEVVHIASISAGQKTLAWLYQDRGGSRWFEGNGARTRYSDVRVAGAAFGAVVTRTTSSAYAIPITGIISASALKGHRYTIHGCF